MGLLSYYEIMAPGYEWGHTLLAEVISFINWSDKVEKNPKFGSPCPSLGMIFLCFRHFIGSQNQSGYGLLEFTWSACSVMATQSVLSLEPSQADVCSNISHSSK